MTPDIKTLQLFVAVVDLGSISEGARHCHLALAAASKRIAQLEGRCGMALLTRHARGVVPTPAGHAYAVQARSVLAALDRLSAELADFQQGIKGLVRVTANASSIAQFLPAQVGDFLQRNPGLKIDLQERSSSEVARAVAGGLADIGVMESTTPTTTPTSELELLPWRSDTLVAVLAQGHALARRKRVTPAELLACEHVALREGTALNRLLAQAAAQAGQTLKVRMQVGSFDAVCRMVEQGIGIGVLPLAAIAPQLKAMRIRCVPVEADWAQRRHVLAVRQVAGLTVAAQALLGHLRASV